MVVTCSSEINIVHDKRSHSCWARRSSHRMGPLSFVVNVPIGLVLVSNLVMLSIEGGILLLKREMYGSDRRKARDTQSKILEVLAMQISSSVLIRMTIRFASILSIASMFTNVSFAIIPSAPLTMQS